MLDNFGFKIMGENRARSLSALNLAYVGDAVYDMFIRFQLVDLYGEWGMNKVNALKVKCVKASKQAQIALSILPLLSEVEATILKRGRNAKSQTVPKNAKLADYKYATGFEALIGYLALSGQSHRLMEVLNSAWLLCQQEMGGQINES